MHIVIVGLGGIGQRHVRNLRALLGERVRMTAVRSRGQRHVLSDALQIVPGQDVEALYGIRSTSEVEAVIRAVLEALQEPFVVEHHHILISCSIARDSCSKVSQGILRPKTSPAMPPGP